MTDEQLDARRRPRSSISPPCWARSSPTYNIPGVSQELKFTPEALAGIFLGKITKWNDAAI